MFGSKLDIFKKEWMEVVFDGRNKAYGAYDLRKLSPKATNIAMLIASTAFVFALLAPTIAKYIGVSTVEESTAPILIEQEVILAEPPPINEEEPPPPPAVEPPPPRVDQVRHVEMVVVPADQVRDEEPATVAQLQIADPGRQTIAGNPDADIRIGLPVGEGSIDAEVTEAGSGIVDFRAMEIPPEPHGGINAFRTWIGNNYRYPDAASSAGVKGAVEVSFVVERDGSLTDIKVVRDLGYGTGQEAVRLLQRAAKWKPGVQNGRPVRVAYTLPIRLDLSQN